MSDETQEFTADEQALANAADAIASAAEPTQDTQAGEVQVAADEPWGPFLQTAIRPLLFGIVLPQWDVNAETQDVWTNSLGQCLDQVFPGGPQGKYACWVQLVLTTAGVAGMCALQNDGKLPPLGPKRKPKNDAIASAAPAATSSNAGGGFSTSA